MHVNNDHDDNPSESAEHITHQVLCCGLDTFCLIYYSQ